jgi:hypothetical protein
MIAPVGDLPDQVPLVLSGRRGDISDGCRQVLQFEERLDDLPALMNEVSAGRPDGDLVAASMRKCLARRNGCGGRSVRQWVEESTAADRSCRSRD